MHHLSCKVIQLKAIIIIFIEIFSSLNILLHSLGYGFLQFPFGFKFYQAIKDIQHNQQ